MPGKLLSSQPNHFLGEVVNTKELTTAPEEFEVQLVESVKVWRENGRKVAWLELDITHSVLVPAAVKAGFEYHHTDSGCVTMTLRLEESAYVPPYATHYIGVGGVVFRDPETLLVVSERFRRGRPPYYKLPGGALLPGEHIQDAIIREVREETGIEARFAHLVCFRHWHRYRYGKSDIYFVCKLEAVTTEIHRQTEEIDECMWMPVDEYLQHPLVHAFNRQVVKAVLEDSGLAPFSIDGYGTPETHELFMPAKSP